MSSAFVHRVVLRRGHTPKKLYHIGSYSPMVLHVVVVESEV